MTFPFEPFRGRWSRWTVVRGPVWAEYAAPGRRLAEQGWKIHVSTTPTDATGVLDATADWCGARAWTFKHLVDAKVLARANDKGAARSGSGKFITVYPPPHELTEAVLDQLASSLEGCVGPRILGDLQWRESTVHLRYGAFRSLRTWDGLRAIRSPIGELEADRRGVLFSPPPWLAIPDWISSEVDRAHASDPGRLRELTVDGAYSFSNAGGVYRAVHERHGRIVVKEGREHVAVNDGCDAAARIEHEHQVLARIRTLNVAPRPHGTFRSGGSSFALLEQIEGTPFNRAVMSRNPLTRSPDPDPASKAVFAADVARTIADLRGRLAVLHADGVVHGDVSPRNVIVQPSGEVRLIDFESAHLEDMASPAGAGIATPGFAAPASLASSARDRFSIACLHLAALVPLTSLIPLDPEKVHDLLAAAERSFPTALLGPVRKTLVSAIGATPSEPTPDHDPLQSLADGLQRRLGSLVTPGLDDGRHGVVLALRRARYRSPHEPLVFHEGDPDAVGLFTGHASEIMHGDADAELFAAVHRAARDGVRVDLKGGLAGLGCALIGSPSERGRDALHVIARRLSAFVRQRDRLQHLPPGLLAGPSGIALFLALYGRVFGVEDSVTAAEHALRVDIERLDTAGDVGLQLRRDGRLVPFLGSGSAGVGVAAIQVSRAGGTIATASLLHGVRDAAATPFTAHAGILDGRAGLVHFLIDLAELEHPSFDRDGIAALLENHRQAFALHRLRSPDGDRYPGAQLDAPDDGYSHGGAGVLSALVAIRDFERGLLEADVLPSFLRAGER